MIDVIIVAAGSSKRMMSGKNKQFLEINNKPIIAWTIENFHKNKKIDNIIVAIRKEDEDIIKNIIKRYDYQNIRLVYGGKERQDSISNCLEHTSSDIVLIHDGARPFIDEETINKCIEYTKEHKTCIVGVPSKDTIKIIDDSEFIIKTPDRNTLWCAQTPQAFHTEIIKRAYTHAKSTGYIGTDDASLVENIGYSVKMVMGSYHNIKITTPEDLVFAEAIAKYRERKK